MKRGFISALSMLTGTAVGVGVVKKVTEDKLKKAEKMSDKYLELFLMMNLWVKVKQEGKNLSSYFEKRGYANIAIYGMSHAGETLVDELRDTDTHVVYGIDKNVGAVHSDIDMFSLDDNFEKVDAVVVTAITFFNEIAEQLVEKINCPIISLEDVLYEV